MWNACRKAFTAGCALTFLSLYGLLAQSYPNGLSADSVNPRKDSIVLGQFRQKLDSIRTVQGRPTVALVLGGGGAKGAAEVGAIKYIEEMGIPVDMVCGTSIGGLVGGIYSMGFSPSYMDSLFRHQDWSVTLTDRVKDQYIPYSRKQHKSKYLVTLPFNRISKPLPPGYSSGFNVNNMFSSTSVGYQDSISFANLPIPFCCVATDLVSCKTVYMGSGNVKKAMRATMSIPGLFDPVRYNNMVLVDGGTRNNFPADIAREAGADYVIGIELGGESPDYSKVRNVGNILSQMITLLGQDAFDKNIPKADVVIRPDVGRFGMLSFSSSAIDSLSSSGYRAAVLEREGLQKIKDKMPFAAMHLHNVPAKDIDANPITIKDVVFTGLTPKETALLEKKLKIEPGQQIDKAGIEDAISKLQATDAFTTVTYSLLGDSNPFTLQFDCEKSPKHEIDLGARADTENWASLLLHLGVNSHALVAPRVNVHARLGQSQAMNAIFSLDVPYLPTLNLEAEIKNMNGKLNDEGESIKATTRYWTHSEKLYLSNIRWTNFHFNIGVKYQYFRMPETSYLSERVKLSYGPESLYGGYAGAYLTASAYTFDDWYFPEKGIHLNLSANRDFYSSSRNPDYYRPISSISGDFKFVIPMGSRVSLIPDIHARLLWDDNDVPSMGHMNYVGGLVAGRYFDQQIPFVGFGNIYIAQSKLAAVNAELRVKAFNKFYVSALGGYFRQSEQIDGLFRKGASQCWGAALQASYKSLIGPVKGSVRWSDMFGWSAYLSIGYDF